jgi:MoaA/NifB/PqqE/SkfB family radical SAM enzyme
VSWAEQSRDLRFAIGILRRRPFQVLLQVTNRCNMQCSFCDFWPNGVAPREELTTADYERVAEELSGLGTFVVSIEGGEPLLRPDLVEIVRVFGRRHIPLLYTNGWHVDEPLARQLWDAGLAQAGVSIDYASAARHDARRKLAGAYSRAWRAVETLRGTAPHAGRQVHVMTVLMRDNTAELDALLQMSARAGVGHCATLLSSNGFRRAPGAEMPSLSEAQSVARAWAAHPHFRMFGDYMRRIPAFVAGGEMPACRAGVQGFNIDHVGNVAQCIEKIDRPFGNVRQEPLAAIHARIVAAEPARGCQECWTACRGFNQALADRGTLGTWRDLAGRMRSV